MNTSTPEHDLKNDFHFPLETYVKRAVRNTDKKHVYAVLKFWGLSLEMELPYFFKYGVKIDQEELGSISWKFIQLPSEASLSTLFCQLWAWKSKATKKPPVIEINSFWEDNTLIKTDEGFIAPIGSTCRNYQSMLQQIYDIVEKEKLENV